MWLEELEELKKEAEAEPTSTEEPAVPVEPPADPKSLPITQPGR